ncbi:119_t:CDS:1, partial [Gigaspora rosea]
RDDFKKHIEILQKYYEFLKLPNNYIKAKEMLLRDPARIKTKTYSNFLIENKNEAKLFIEEIKDKYRYPIAFLLEYIKVNSTEKPELLENPMKIQFANLTLLITTKNG